MWARFARNVEWDFFCDFQTLCVFVVMTENLLCIGADTCINFQDMVPNEPDQVGKVGDGGFVDNEPQHGLIFHFVNIETQGPHRDSHHRFTVVKELDGFRVQREIVGVLQSKSLD